MRRILLQACLLGGVILLGRPAAADPFNFSTGAPDGRIGMASRPGPGPGGGVNQETEAADDFFAPGLTTINSATFAGLIPAGATASQVVVEIYRIFPLDSNTSRTPKVPTRTNSPSDVEFVGRDSAVAGELSFTTTNLATSFPVANSVDTGIHPSPGNTTGGDGPASGQEVQFNVTFTSPIVLPTDHYFFVPQVLLTNPNQHFLWLSAAGPPLFTGDLQAWIRNADLDPDWLRVRTDITGGTAGFNAAFSLTGTFVPEPSSLFLLGAGGVLLLVRARRTRTRPRA